MIFIHSLTEILSGLSPVYLWIALSIFAIVTVGSIWLALFLGNLLEKWFDKKRGELKDAEDKALGR